jgi:YD repeat-containing protein
VGSVIWGYNADFKPKEEKVLVGSVSTLQFGYDNDGLLVCASPTSCALAGADAFKLTYNTNNTLLNTMTLRGVATSVSYNTFGEVASESSNFGATALLSETYATATNPRDALGRVASRVELVQGSNTQSQYSYDTSGRLTDVVSAAGASHYTYDANGNRLTAQTASGAASATYDNQDRLLTYGIYSYTYTANGELSRKTNTVDGTFTSYTYDAFGILQRVELPNADVIEYVTDAYQRRIAKKKNGAYVKRWLYRDALHPVAELDGNGV